MYSKVISDTYRPSLKKSFIYFWLFTVFIDARRLSEIVLSRGY